MLYEVITHAGAVSKQNRRVPAGGGEVEAGRLDLRPDEQNAPVLTRPDPGVGDRQPVDEPAALVAYVERGNPRNAQHSL